MKINMKSISSKLILAGIGIALVPMVIIGGLSYTKSKSALMNLSSEQSQGIARDMAHTIDAILTAELGKIASIAASEKIVNLSTFVHEKGVDASIEQTKDCLKDLRNQFSRMGEAYQGIFIADAKGLIYTGVLEGGEIYPKIDISKSEMIQRVKQSGQPVISEMFLSNATGNPISNAVAPIKGINGQLHGFVGLVIKASYFTDLVSGRKLGKTGYGFMIDDKGYILAHPKTEHVLNLNIVSLPDMSEITPRMTAGETGVERYTFEGIKKIAGFSPVKFNGWSVCVTQNEEEFLAAASAIFIATLLIGLLVLLFSILIIYRLVARLIAPLDGLAKRADRVALGDLDFDEIILSQDEIGRVNSAFQKVTQSLRGITNVCEAVSHGDFTQTVQVRGDNDILCKSINQMTQTLRDVVNQANVIAQGDYSSEIKPHSETDELGFALANMTQQLRDTKLANQQENWFKTGQSELNDVMRGEQSLADLTQKIISQLASFLDAQIGAIFLSQDNKTLQLISSYAYTQRKSLSNEFKPGQGLVGQAFVEKKTIIITEAPEDYIVIQSGLGQGVPKTIITIPLLHDNKTLGVIELATFKTFSQLHITFLEQVAENIAIAINAALSRTRLSELLSETQRQSKALETQQKELELNNRILEDQTEQLKNSEELLIEQQEELERANAQLEDKTASLEAQARELELSRDRIQAKSKELELSNQYKSEFLSNMSHELRTPLNSLLILAKMLKDNTEGNLTEEQIQSSRMIYEGGEELLSLINEILDLAKIEAGRMEIKTDTISIAQLADSLEMNFIHVAEEKHLDFSVEVDPALPITMQTDGKRTKQILKNLLGNAFKFTATGSIRLSLGRPDNDVDLSNSNLDPQKTVAFVVSDTGIGISKAKQELIFEAFQQADGNIDREYGGTGLGLSISHNLAMLLGGEIQLQSEENQGSQFTLYLPENNIPLDSGGTDDQSPPIMLNQEEKCSQVQMSDLPTPLEIESDDWHPQEQQVLWRQPHEKEQILEGKTILIVDDDMRNIFALSHALKAKSMTVLRAENGQEALSMLAAHPNIDIVLMDIMMPVMDGYVAIQKIREQTQYKDLPILALTAKAMTGDREKCLQAGASDYITKPIDLDKVFSMLRVWLYNRKSEVYANARD